VVLVHDAFTDASSWAAVVTQLQAAGVPVLAVANPLRGLAADADAVLSALPDGPLLLAGHGYGGAVATEAAGRCGEPGRVVGLTYVAGYALDAGESVGALPGTVGAAELTLDPVGFAALLAADICVHTAAVLAASQRPLARGALTDRAGTPAWRTLPSWYLIAADDRLLPAATQRRMADRARCRTTETAGSHAVPVSQPTAVTDVLLTAARVLG